jgi:hypothetical protein
MNDLSAFNASFQAVADPIMDGVAESLFEQELDQPTREQIIGQLLMEQLFAHPCDPENTGRDIGTLTTEAKSSLVRIAAHIGPDYAQALYRAAVFITKVV